jgi:hypothetical protein
MFTCIISLTVIVPFHKIKWFYSVHNSRSLVKTLTVSYLTGNLKLYVRMAKQRCNTANCKNTCCKGKSNYKHSNYLSLSHIYGWLPITTLLFLKMFRSTLSQVAGIFATRRKGQLNKLQTSRMYIHGAFNQFQTSQRNSLECLQTFLTPLTWSCKNPGFL